MIPRALDMIVMEQALPEFHGVDGITGDGNTDQAAIRRRNGLTKSRLFSKIRLKCVELIPFTIRYVIIRPFNAYYIPYRKRYQLDKM